MINWHLIPKGIFTCECGFQWRRGENGNHRCEPYYREQIASLQKNCKALKDENAAMESARAALEEAKEIIERLEHQLKEALEGKVKFAAFDGKPMRVVFSGYISALGAKLLHAGVAGHTCTITREKSLPDDVAVYLRGE